MKLRDARHFGQWVFFIGGKDDSDDPDLEIKEMRVPPFGYANSKKQLMREVMQEITNLHSQGATGYLLSLREEAESYGKSPKEFLSDLIEHQICSRAQNKATLCWNMTLGDKVHSVAEGVDNLVAKAPAPVKKAWAKVVKAVTPKASVPGRVSSCRSCGGTRSLKVSRNNRGRSGRV